MGAQRAVRGAEVDGCDPVAAGDRPAVPAAEDADAAAEARGDEPAQAVGAHDDGSLGADAAYAGGAGEADEHAVAVRVPADGHGLPDVRPGSGDDAEVNGAAPTYVRGVGRTVWSCRVLVIKLAATLSFVGNSMRTTAG